MATTRILLDRLQTDPTIRRLCGWERKAEVPSESTFSRALTEFADSRLPERVHQALIEQHLGEQVVGHISRDSTAIEAREKPEKKAAPVEKKPKKRGRPKKGEERPKEPTRLERQAAGLPLSEMIADLFLVRPVPVVIGNGGKFDLTDHHHMANALWKTAEGKSKAGIDSKNARVVVTVQYNRARLMGYHSWKAMQGLRLVYLFDNYGGGPIRPKDLCTHIKDLSNDPYRSLAWKVP